MMRDPGRRRRVLFLVRSFDAGGTERQLVELLRGLDRRRFEVTVATLYDGGAFAAEVAGLDGISRRSLSKRHRTDPRFLVRFARLVGEVRPDVISSYLWSVNEMALLAGIVARVPVIWNIRSAYLDFSQYGWLPRTSFRVGAWLSRWPAATVFNSWAGLRFHQQHGYRPRRATVIQNGVDVEHYRPDPAAGAAVRAEWGVPVNAPLIGIVGRADPAKDHATFLRACAEVARSQPGLRVACVGVGLSAASTPWGALSAELGLEQRAKWAGFRQDMRAVYNALDVTVSSSIGEGFPNVIAESMACGTTCVVTDAGDSREIVGDTGAVVPVRDPSALAHGIATQLGRDRRRAGDDARARIGARYSRPQMVARTEDLLDAV